MREISDDSLEALRRSNAPPRLFVRGGQMVRIVLDENQRSMIVAVDIPFLRGCMDRAADYFRMTDRGRRHTYPPKDVASDILALPPETWGFPPLGGLTETPFLRADGTVVDSGGYDAATGVVYIRPPSLKILKIKDFPEEDDIARSRAVLKEALAEFPFEDESSRTNTLALLLTPINRVAIRGPVPLALIEAPQSGTGKSLLADLIAVVTTGSCAAMMSAPKEDEEWRKNITATLAAGATFIIYDNVKHPLQSPNLAMALTTSFWKDRILGVSQTVTIPQRATWVATGNNIRLGGDLPRRCYRIRLDSKMSRPWTRTGFLHPDLINWASANRGELVAALLTIARAWYAVGQPQAETVVRLGSFEEWSRIMSGILAHVGFKGFLSNLDQLYELSDDATPQWECFLNAVHEMYGEDSFTAAELVSQLQSNKTFMECLPEELAAALGDRDSPSQGFRVKLGKALRQRVDTRYGSTGLHVERAGSESRGGQVRWKVVPAGIQGSQV